MLNRRVNILFNESLWQMLSLLAKKKKVSIGELVRHAVQKEYAEGKRREQIREACEAIEKHRRFVKGTIDYKALINYGRR